MGLWDGNHSGFGVGSSNNSSGSNRPMTTNSARIHDRQHCHRERRFHVPRQALGVDYESYDVARPSLPSPPPATEPLTTAIECEALSDQDVLQQPARSGMRICAWSFWILLVVIHYKLIIALWINAASAWPNLR
jgi:hypothetical protein